MFGRRDAVVYGYGSRIFCTDESKRIGCDSEHFWNKGLVVREAG